MSTTNTEVGIKIVIDAKDGRQELRLSEEDLIKLISKSDILKDKFKGAFAEMSPAAKQLKSELLGITGSTDEVSEAVADYIKYNNLSEQEIKQVSSALQEQKALLAINGMEYGSHQKAIQALSGGYDRLRSTQSQAAQGSGMMTQSLTQLGWVFSDADMFMVNFQMGLRSVANNIPMVVQGLMQANDAAKAAGRTFKQELVASLAGPGGIMLAVTGATLLLQILSKVFSDSTKEVKNQAKEVKNLAKEYENLGTAEINYTKDKINRELTQKIFKADPKARVLTGSTGELAYMGLNPDKNLIGEDGKETDETISNAIQDANLKIKALNQTSENAGIILTSIFMGNVPKSVNETRKAIEALNRELDATSDEKQRAKIQDKIKELTKLEESYKGKQDKNEINSLADLKKEYQELTSELQTLRRLKSTIMDQHDEEIFLAKSEADANLKGIKAQINELEKKKDKQSDDQQKITNLNLKIQIEQERLSQKLKKIDDDYAEKRKNTSLAYIETVVTEYEIYKELSDLKGQSSNYALEETIKELEAYKKTVKTAEERLKIEQAIQSLRNSRFGEMSKVNVRDQKTPQDYEDEEAQITQALWNEKEKRINIVQQITSNIANAYSTMYQYLHELGSKEARDWENRELKKLSQEEKNALKHARTERERERISEEYQRRKEAVEDEAQRRAKAKAQEWFEFQKWANFALTLTSAYRAATSALEPPPVGLGPVAGIPLAASTVIAGIANAAVIAKQQMPGFEKGGIVVGEKGPEIIAPMQDYAQGWARLVAITSASTIMAVRQNLENLKLRSGSQVNDAYSSGLDSLREDIRNRPTQVNVFLGKKEMKRIYIEGNAQVRSTRG